MTDIAAPKVEPGDESDSSSGSTAVNVEGVPLGGLLDSARVSISKAEKKARKVISKLRVKPVKGVVRVIVRKSKNIVFVIDNPEVVKLQALDTYIVFGDITVDDLNHRAKLVAADQFKTPVLVENAAAVAEASNLKEEADEESDDEALDATGLDPKEIELVMSQAHVGRRRAIVALRENDNDIVNAIMAITM